MSRRTSTRTADEALIEAVADLYERDRAELLETRQPGWRELRRMLKAAIKELREGGPAR